MSVLLRESRNEPDWDAASYKKARANYLMQFVFGETMATDCCQIMQTFAPDQEAVAFLEIQEKEERYHTELLLDALRQMDYPPAPLASHLKKLHIIMAEAVQKESWPDTLFLQNFIVEGIALTIFKEQRKHGDEVIMHVFDLIIRDEEKHVAFGIREMQKILAGKGRNAALRTLIPLQRRALYHTILLFKDLALGAGALGMRWDDLAKTVFEDHLTRVRSAGLPMPLIDRLFLRIAIIFCRVI